MRLWRILLPLAMLAVGYLLGRHASEDDARAERFPGATAREPVQPTPASDIERLDDHDAAVRALFKGLRASLTRLDYDRLFWSESWVEMLNER